MLNVEQELQNGNIRVQKHNDLPLRIFNYTQQCQYKGNWNETTLNCRGLILDDKEDVVARPFKKFFNLEEIGEENLPENEKFEVFEKIDGSLIILFNFREEWHFASRGSFYSEHAEEAKRIWNDEPFDNLDPNVTYLFEIIFPENRIVVDYGDRRELVFLAAINKETGEEHNIYDFKNPILPVRWARPNKTNMNDVRKLKQLEEKNKEGFVIRYESGIRVKVKFEEYKRLHFLMTKLSNRSIWKCLSNDDNFEEMLRDVPDEIFKWISDQIEDFQKRFQMIEEISRRQFEERPKNGTTRKDIASYFLLEGSYKSILFSMLDNKPFNHIIWKMLEPEEVEYFGNVHD